MNGGEVYLGRDILEVFHYVNSELSYRFTDILFDEIAVEDHSMLNIKSYNDKLILELSKKSSDTIIENLLN